MAGNRSICVIILLWFGLFIGTNASGQTIEKRILKEMGIASLTQLSIINHEGDIDIVKGDADVVRFDILLQAIGKNESDAQRILDLAVIHFKEEPNRLVVKSPEQIEPEISKNIKSGFLKINYRIEVPAEINLSLTTSRGNIYVETLDNDLSIDLSDGKVSLGDINGKLLLQMTKSKGSISQIRSGEFILKYANLEMEDAESLSLDLMHSNIKAGTCEDVSLTSSSSTIHAISVTNIKYSGKKDSLTLERVDSMNCIASHTYLQIQELHQRGNFNMRYGELRIDEVYATLSNLLIKSAYGTTSLKFLGGTPYAIEANLKHATISHSISRINENIQKKNRYVFKALQGKGTVPVHINIHYGALILR